jgi:hypothetical protein
MCLSGPEAETLFCGPIRDCGCDEDYAIASSYLSRQFSSPLRIAAELRAGYRRAARLVRTAQARDRICLIADALLRKGTLSGEDIYALGCMR